LWGDRGSKWRGAGRGAKEEVDIDSLSLSQKCHKRPTTGAKETYYMIWKLA